jgi:hypothetical protein
MECVKARQFIAMGTRNYIMTVINFTQNFFIYRIQKDISCQPRHTNWITWRKTGAIKCSHWSLECILGDILTKLSHRKLHNQCTWIHILVSLKYSSYRTISNFPSLSSTKVLIGGSDNNSLCCKLWSFSWKILPCKTFLWCWMLWLVCEHRAPATDK